MDYARRRSQMWVTRAARKVSGSTILQELTFLRVVMKTAREDWGLNVSTEAIDKGKRVLKEEKLIGQSAPRTKRPTREELQSLVDYFAESEKHPRSRIPMRDIMEFALWTARRLGEICELKWEHFNPAANTCQVSIKTAGGVRLHEFPLLGKAREIIDRQPTKGKNPEIFPYNAKSASQAYQMAKKELSIENLRFQDLRRESAIRLYETHHTVEEIAKVTGRLDLNTLLRDIRSPSSGEALGS